MFPNVLALPGEHRHSPIPHPYFGRDVPDKNDAWGRGMKRSQIGRSSPMTSDLRQ